MRAVLISIRPKWVEKITRGEKTLEVRKTRPKLKTPFKCYIYCTKDTRDTDRLWVLNGQLRQEYGGLTAVCANLAERPERHYMGNGKVVGEFVCDTILPVTVECSSPADLGAGLEVPGTCLTDREILDYLGNGKQGYLWHISGLKIYDDPVDLAHFHNCAHCEFPFCEKQCHSPMQHPPQSWCYVEG